MNAKKEAREKIEKELNIQRNHKNKDVNHIMTEKELNQLNYYNEIAKKNTHALMNNPTLKEVIRITTEESCLDQIKELEKLKNNKDLPKLLEALPLIRVERMNYKNLEICQMRHKLHSVYVGEINKQKGQQFATNVFNKRLKQGKKYAQVTPKDKLYKENTYNNNKIQKKEAENISNNNNNNTSQKKEVENISNITNKNKLYTPNSELAVTNYSTNTDTSIKRNLNFENNEINNIENSANKMEKSLNYNNKTLNNDNNKSSALNLKKNFINNNFNIYNRNSINNNTNNTSTLMVQSRSFIGRNGPRNFFNQLNKNTNVNANINTNEIKNIKIRHRNISNNILDMNNNSNSISTNITVPEERIKIRVYKRKGKEEENNKNSENNTIINGNGHNGLFKGTRMKYKKKY